MSALVVSSLVPRTPFVPHTSFVEQRGSHNLLRSGPSVCVLVAFLFTHVSPEKMHGTASVDATAHKRAAVRETVVDDLLTEFASQPTAKIKVKKTKVRRYPCFGCRKVFGCAHVDLHTTVLEGKLSTCRRTLRRLGKKKDSSLRINEHGEIGKRAARCVLSA